MERPSILDYDTANCSIGAAVGIIGERQTFLVLREAFLRTRRFEDFQARRSQSFWTEIRQVVSEWDELIHEFNSRTGVLEDL